MAFDYDSEVAKFSTLRKRWASIKAEIDADKILPPDVKRAKKAEAYKPILAEHARLQASFKATIQAERDRLRRAAFSPTTSSDMATHRQIVSEAASADGKARRRLYERFDLSGDRAGKTAVLAAAAETGDYDLISSAGDSAAGAFLEFEKTFGELRGLPAKMTISSAISQPDL